MYNVERNNRLCTLCELNDLEDEYHFILTCPCYSDIRSLYIKKYYVRNSSVYKLTHAFKRRKYQGTSLSCKTYNCR